MQAIIRRLRLFKEAQKGVSNVIVVMLSLILVTLIVSNVVLWSYQMNQFDLERMQENVKISNVTRITYSQWSVVNGEYHLNVGELVNGDYRDTQAIDGYYEGFAEASTVPTWWYNGSWLYRRTITIDNAGNTDSLADFQISLNLDTASLIAAGKMRSDCGDIRFTDSDGVTLINYWIESGVNSANTRIWVKVPLIPANSVKTIYMYYGNMDAASMSNINDVLEAYYRKVNVPYRWENRISTVDVANGDDVGSWQNITFDFPFWREFKSRVYVCSNGFGIFDPTSATNDWTNSLTELRRRCKIAPFWDDLRTDVNGGIVSEAGVYVDSYTDRFVITWETTRYGALGDSIKFQAVLYRNGDIRFTIDNSTNFNNFTPTLGISKGDNVNYIDITAERASEKSWLFMLRKYASNEPTVTVGLEETYLRYRLEIVGSFIINLPSQMGDIDVIEILLRYRAGDAYESWYIKAYDWAYAIYSDEGFNSTMGHAPSTEWSYYAVSIANWHSYVHSNGTMRIMFHDAGEDINRTAVDIDFWGVRVKVACAQFSVKNSGSATAHIVAIWIVNATVHMRYEANYFLNVGEEATFIRADIKLPEGDFIVKVVTERGNIAVFTP